MGSIHKIAEEGKHRREGYSTSDIIFDPPTPRTKSERQKRTKHEFAGTMGGGLLGAVGGGTLANLADKHDKIPDGLRQFQDSPTWAGAALGGAAGYLGGGLLGSISGNRAVFKDRIERGEPAWTEYDEAAAQRRASGRETPAEKVKQLPEVIR